LAKVLDQDNTVFAPAVNWNTVETSFGNGLYLKEIAYGDTSGANNPDVQAVPAGETAWVVLHWQILNTMPENYQVSVRLVDQDNYSVGQVDGLISSAWHVPTNGVRPGEEIYTYLLLPLQSTTLPQSYSLQVLVYSAKTQTPVLSSTGAMAVATGQFNVTPSLNVSSQLAQQGSLAPWKTGLLVGLNAELPPLLRPGTQFTLPLVWQNTAEQQQDIVFALELVGNEENILLAENIVVGGSAYPTSQWRFNEILQQPIAIQLPLTLSTGDYYLQLVDPTSETGYVLGQWFIEDYPREFNLPVSLGYEPDAFLGNAIKLGGVDIALAEEETITLTLYWQALATPMDDYKVFVHALDAAGNIVAQQDKMSGNGEMPTSVWVSEQVVPDIYNFPEQAQIQTFLVGMYNPQTGARLPVTQAGEPVPDNAIRLDRE